MATYKIVDLFGNEETRLIQKSGNKKPDLFNDYESFVEKFEEKKTTDDCYTPSDVYNLVLNYVREKCSIEGLEIIRPFYPDGDYENIDYPENSVVIDNPPFSIISQIARFYISRNIKFFLFAPHLTLFSANMDCTRIVVGGNIVYENGAVVKTSFLSNLFGEIGIIGDAELFIEIEKIKDKNKTNLPKYKYPDNVLTVSHLTYIVERGVSISIDKKDIAHCPALDAQKKPKKTIFGSGFLLSEKAAAEKAAAEKAAAQADNVIIWELSEREKEIIKQLEIRTQ
jgi:hypothetical protein